MRLANLCLIVALLGCGDDTEPVATDGSSTGGGDTTSTSGTMSTSSTQASSAGSDSTGAGGSSSSSGADETATPTSETGEVACYPESIYGKCSENPGCQCLQGATVYQVCTQNCAGAEDCGDASDFNGATPGCFPINPGAADMICALLCTDTSQCPCGLVCMPSGAGANLCAEPQ